MKVYLRTFFCISFIMIMVFTSIASANSLLDEEEDVVKIELASKDQKTDQIKDTVDISKVNVNIVGNSTIELTMIIFGEITNNSQTKYQIWYNMSNSSYLLSYSNGQHNGWAKKIGPNGETIETFSPIESMVRNGNLIKATYPIIDDITNYTDYWGYAKTIENESTSFIDIVPNTRSIDQGNQTDQDTEPSDQEDQNNNTTNDDSTEESTDTPGFTLIILIMAFIILLFSIYKKK